MSDGFDVKKFVDSFPTLAEADGGIKRLRQLVLALAVRGRLVEPAEDAGSLSQLFKDIETKRARLVAERRASRSDDLAPVPDDEVPFPIPGSWRWVRFGTATICRDGQRVPITKDARKAGPYDYYGASGVIDKVDGFIFDESLLLIGEDGANLVNRATPIAFLAAGQYWVNNHAHVLDGASVDMLRFLSVFINATDLTPYVTGTAQPKMNQAKMNEIPVAVPPLAEQKRIVAKVDELMKLIDDMEAKQTRATATQSRFRTSALDALTKAEGPEELAVAWKRVSGNFETMFERAESVGDLRSRLLELAMRGLLTKAAKSDDSVDDLIERLDEDLGVNKKTYEVVEEPPHEIPGHWRWVRWGNLTHGTSSGWSPQCENRRRADDEWGVLKVSAVSWFAFRADENKALPRSLKPRPEFAVRAGDFLMSRANTSDLVGRSVIVGEAPERLLLSDKLVRVEFSTLIEAGFVNIYNRTAAARAHYKEHASGTSDSMKNISREVILAMPVPLPPLAEQRRIVGKVEALMKLCDHLEAKLKNKEATASKLVEAVVRELVA